MKCAHISLLMIRFIVCCLLSHVVLRSAKHYVQILKSCVNTPFSSEICHVAGRHAFYVRAQCTDVHVHI
jgi:hypothetical protein